MIATFNVETERVIRLAKGQPCYKTPGGPIVTRMSRTADVGYAGHAGGGWGQVKIYTGKPYKDGKTRPTGLYVPIKAGPIRDR